MFPINIDIYFCLLYSVDVLLYCGPLLSQASSMFETKYCVSPRQAKSRSFLLHSNESHLLCTSNYSKGWHFISLIIIEHFVAVILLIQHLTVISKALRVRLKFWMTSSIKTLGADLVPFLPQSTSAFKHVGSGNWWTISI